MGLGIPGVCPVVLAAIREGLGIRDITLALPDWDTASREA